MTQELVVRIRGTFIDVGTDALSTLHKNRSHSAPPIQGARSSSIPSECGGSQYNESEYIASWIKNATHVLNDARSHPTRGRSKTYGGQSTVCDIIEANSGPPSPTTCGQSDSSATLDSWALESPSTPDSKSNDDLVSWNHSNFANSTQQQSVQWPSQESPGTIQAQWPSPETPGIIGAQWPSPESPDTVEGVTTLMICDIPCRQNIDNIIEAINSFGFANTYDLIYMPSHKRTRVVSHFHNVGYAFVNFKRPEYATAFGDVFYDFRFPICLSEKLTYTRPATHQGYQANLDMHFKQRHASGCLVTYRDEDSCAVAWQSR